MRYSEPRPRRTSLAMRMRSELEWVPAALTLAEIYEGLSFG